MATGILLEAGTNEMELLVFRVGESIFGINVAKVRELIQRINTVKVPHSPHAVEGSFKLREEVLTLIDLGKYLNIAGDDREQNEGLIIIIELNETRCGLLVDAVEMIHRLSWDQIEPPTAYITDLGAPITATAMLDDRVVQVLDFETIIGELLGVGAMSFSGENVAENSASESCPAQILVADDSPTVRQTLESMLRMAGYEHVTLCSDGQQAWDTMLASKSSGKRFDIILSDVEMPKIDGLHLTARVKEDPDLASTPVILFSSIINEDTLNKGNSVGADAQVAKSDPKGLLEALERCLAANKV